MSLASELSAAIKTRLQGITIANGYNTDIGLRVFAGRGSINIEEVPCIVLVEEDESVEEQSGTQARVVLPYTIEAHDACDPLNPNDKAHLMLADLKRAIFAGDRTFGGKLIKPKDGLQYTGRSIEVRPDGVKLVAASITIEVRYVENLSEP